MTVVRASVAAAFCGPEAGAVLAHGPTFMGHALGCAVANASLDLFETEPRREQAAAIEAQLREELRPCARFAHVRDVRICGAIGVVELAAAPDLDALRARSDRAEDDAGLFEIPPLREKDPAKSDPLGLDPVENSLGRCPAI